MNKKMLFPSLLITFVLAIVFVNKSPKFNNQDLSLPPNDAASDTANNQDLYLTPTNTTSVTTDEYHQSPSVNDPSYKSGEWTKNNGETYASLIKLDIPQLADISQTTLHLKLSAYHNKDIFSTNKKGTCGMPKNFAIKKILSSWEPKTSTYNIIQDLQEASQTIGSFKISSNPQIGSYISIDVSASGISSPHGFTIDQTDSTPCRVSFYGHTSDPTNRPYLTY